MRHLIIFIGIIFAAVLTVVSCKKEATAMAAAEHYYKCLMDSDYNTWIDGTIHSEALTPEIRQERIDMMRQYLHAEQQHRKGLQAAKALRDTIVEDNAFVFMELQFGDSTSEEILVPMVRVGEIWKMK